MDKLEEYIKSLETQIDYIKKTIEEKLVFVQRNVYYLPHDYNRKVFGSQLDEMTYYFSIYILTEYLMENKIISLDNFGDIASMKIKAKYNDSIVYLNNAGFNFNIPKQEYYDYVISEIAKYEPLRDELKKVFGEELISKFPHLKSMYSELNDLKNIMVNTLERRKIEKASPEEIKYIYLEKVTRVPLLNRDIELLEEKIKELEEEKKELQEKTSDNKIVVFSTENNPGYIRINEEIAKCEEQIARYEKEKTQIIEKVDNKEPEELRQEILGKMRDFEKENELAKQIESEISKIENSRYRSYPKETLQRDMRLQEEKLNWKNPNEVLRVKELAVYEIKKSNEYKEYCQLMQKSEELDLGEMSRTRGEIQRLRKEHVEIEKAEYSLNKMGFFKKMSSEGKRLSDVCSKKQSVEEQLNLLEIKMSELNQKYFELKREAKNLGEKLADLAVQMNLCASRNDVDESNFIVWLEKYIANLYKQMNDNIHKEKMLEEERKKYEFNKEIMDAMNNVDEYEKIKNMENDSYFEHLSKAIDLINASSGEEEPNLEENKKSM